MSETPWREPRETPEELRDAFASLDADEPDQEAIARLRSRLGPVLAPPDGDGGGGEGALPSPNAGAGGSGAAPRLPILVAGVAALMLAGAGVMLVMTEREDTHVSMSVPVAESTVEIPTPQPAAAPLPEASPAPILPEPDRPAMPSSDLVVEAQMLERARAELGSSPATALRITAEHARRYPRGALRQEREVLAIDASFRLGRSDAARARAERFLASHGDSAHAARVRRLLAAHPAPSE